MPSWLPASPHQISVLALVIVRLSCLTLGMPAFGNRFVPWNARLLLASLVSLLIAPLWWQSGHVQIDDLASQFVGEAMLGLWFALAIAILVSGLQVGGHLISILSGLTLTESADASSGAVRPVFATLLEGLACCVFLLLGGHRLVVRAILDCFSLYPPGTISEQASFPLPEVLTQSFLLGIRIGAPVILLSLSTTLLIGIVGRTAAQLNYLTMGASINVVAAVAATALATGTITMLLQAEAPRIAEWITDVDTEHAAGSPSVLPAMPGVTFSTAGTTRDNFTQQFPDTETP